MQAARMDRTTALKTQPISWADLLDHTPEAAKAVMEVVLGRRVFAAEAAGELRRAKRSVDVTTMVEDTVDNFKRCPLSAELPKTMLYKMITGKRV